MKQSPIFVRTYDLLLWLIPCTTKFPREQRFVLGKAVQETTLRFYLRLCQDLEIITLRQYRHVAEMVAEVGRLLGGWHKKAFGM
ncbi:MAG: four helix bundle protein [Chloroflexota bacterium]|nr:four helix bundle protein [Chloroflexota bacterium]